MSVILQTLTFSNMFSYGTNNILDLSKNRVTQLLAANGCLAGDSIILSAKGGSYTIREIVENRLSIEVLGVAEDNTPIITKVVNWFTHEPKLVYKVQLDNGNLLFITDNHLLKTPDGWTPLKDLKVNDWIVDSRERTYTQVETNHTDEWWELVTYLITEGGLSDYTHKITFTNQDTDIQTKFVSKLKSIDSRLSISFKEGREDSINILFDRDSRLKQKFIEQVVVPEIRGYALEKTFPESVFSVSDQTLDKIFAAYLETDGSVEKNTAISFSTSSIKLGHQLLHLLRYRYDIQCSSRIRRTTHADNMEIRISRLDQLHTFAKRVLPHIAGYKKEKLVDLLNKTSSSTSYTQDLIPKKYLKGLRSNDTHNNPYCSEAAAKAYTSFKATKHGITRSNYDLLVDSKYITSLDHSNNTRYLRIKAITPLSEQVVYDIQTTCSNFVAGDILVHNSGKSSLAIIIQELLYNKNIKGLKKSDILNRYSNSKSWEGRIDFIADGKKYAVLSKRTGASTNVTLLQEGKDISEHKVLDTYKRIADILGRDFETFSQLTYQSSTDSLEFLKATDANRKKFLINLFNLERYIEIGEQLKTLVSAKEKELVSKQGELKTVVNFVETNAIPERAFEREVPGIDTSLYARIEALKTAITAQRRICDQIDKNNLYIKERDSLSFDMGLQEVVVPQQLVEQIATTQASISQKTALENKIRKDLKSLDLTEVCFACKQPIDNSQSRALNAELNEELKVIGAEIEHARRTFNALALELKAIETAKKQFDINQKNIDRFSQLSQLINPSIPLEYPDYNKLNNDLKAVEKELAWQEKAEKEAKLYNDSVKIRNAKIDALVEQIRNFKARQELLNNDILDIQEEITKLSILRKAFSTSGIVAFKLENVAKQLEDGINYYLAMLSDGQFQIVFRLDGEKLNVVVVNNGQEVTIDSLSGGEFSRVQTSVLLAVRKTLTTLGGKSINLLFLDEITGVLDESGKERLFEVLQEEQDLNVFLISHDYSHPLIPKLEIIKENNISSIAS